MKTAKEFVLSKYPVAFLSFNNEIKKYFIEIKIKNSDYYKKLGYYSFNGDMAWQSAKDYIISEGKSKTENGK